MLGVLKWLSGKEFACQAGDTGSIAGLGISLEKKMATHSSILPWEIPWTEEPGGLQSIAWQRVGYDRNQGLSMHACMYASGSASKCSPKCRCSIMNILLLESSKFSLLAQKKWYHIFDFPQ